MRAVSDIDEETTNDRSKARIAVVAVVTVVAVVVIVYLGTAGG
jgi:hypothetical protein